MIQYSYRLKSEKIYAQYSRDCTCGMNEIIEEVIWNELLRLQIKREG